MPDHRTQRPTTSKPKLALPRGLIDAAGALEKTNAVRCAVGELLAAWHHIAETELVR